MRKIIDGLLYDTDDATPIAWNSDFDAGFLDCEDWMTTLYMTSNGRFFLHVESSHLGFLYIDRDEYIKPVSEEKAQQFAMRHNPHNFNVIWGNRIKKA